MDAPLAVWTEDLPNNALIKVRRRCAVAFCLSRHGSAHSQALHLVLVA
jgi:hypothetical protein